jgi:alpha-galactosidase
MDILPFDCGFDQPAHYESFKPVKLEVGALGGGRMKKAKPLWKIEATENSVAIRKKIGGWILSQRITAGTAGFKIHTSITRPASRKFPSSLNIFRLPARDFLRDSKIFKTGGVMGDISIQEAKETAEGNISVGILSAQKKDAAWLLFSKPSSEYPLYFGFFNESWEAMVKLPLCPSEQTVDLDTVEIIFGKSAQTLLEEFAGNSALPAAELRQPPKVWNSWDFYHSSISYDKIMQNAKAIASSPVLKKQIEYVVMDMGWEMRFGEWEADSKFPGGMERIAKDIMALGLKPGLWLAPIIIDPECNEFQDDYSFVGKNCYGFPDRTYECCGLFGYVLDVTAPKGEKYLFDLFRRYRDMGYSYFKLDFLRFVMYVHEFADKSLTNVAVMRLALKIIRRAVGPDAYILGCNLPFEVGPGYCDICRVSGDVAIFWENIKKNAKAITATYFFNGRWWYNDPDFLVVRGKDTYTGTGKEPVYKTWWFARNDEFENIKVSEYYQNLHNFDRTLSLEEARTHASLELMLGGAYALGDPVHYLNKNGLALYYKVLEAQKGPGRPLGLFEENGLPGTWVQELKDKVRIGFFNWGEKSRKFSVDLNKMGVQSRKGLDFWSEEKLPINSNIVTMKLAPHHCRVLEFSK